MNERVVIVVVYAVVLGWCAHALWLDEKKRIVWDAADKAAEQMRYWQSVREAAPQPAEATAEHR